MLDVEERERQGQCTYGEFLRQVVALSFPLSELEELERVSSDGVLARIRSARAREPTPFRLTAKRAKRDRCWHTAARCALLPCLHDVARVLVTRVTRLLEHLHRALLVFLDTDAVSE